MQPVVGCHVAFCFASRVNRLSRPVAGLLTARQEADWAWWSPGCRYRTAGTRRSRPSCTSGSVLSYTCLGHLTRHRNASGPSSGSRSVKSAMKQKENSSYKSKLPIHLWNLAIESFVNDKKWSGLLHAPNTRVKTTNFTAFISLCSFCMTFAPSKTVLRHHGPFLYVFNYIVHCRIELHLTFKVAMKHKLLKRRI